MGSDFSNCIALKQKCLKRLGHFFLFVSLESWEILKKQWPTLKFLKPGPLDCLVGPYGSIWMYTMFFLHAGWPQIQHAGGPQGRRHGEEAD